jgi:hypothetical protein
VRPARDACALQRNASRRVAFRNKDSCVRCSSAAFWTFSPRAGVAWTGNDPGGQKQAPMAGQTRSHRLLILGGLPFFYGNTLGPQDSAIGQTLLRGLPC